MNYPKIIAVDFDGCLCEKKWPDIGAANWDAIHALIRRRAEGDKVILWTCRDGQMLDAAILWCLNHGLKFDAINDNLESNKEQFGNNTRKVFADEYWDDKAVPVIAGSSQLVSRVVVYGKKKEKRKRLLERLKELFLRWGT